MAKRILITPLIVHEKGVVSHLIYIWVKSEGAQCY